MQALLNFLAGLRNTAKDAFKVELSGSNVTDGDGTLEATFEKDTNGNGVLRVVDAAPFAYNSETSSFLVKNVMEYFGNSADTKPTTGVTTGATYYVINSKEVYMWNGTTWVFQYSL